MARPDDVADAAVTVLATRGLRGLTHRAVDAEATLPQGSTSNCFRTRAELITAIVDRLEFLDRESLTGVGPPDVTSVDAFAHDIAGRVAVMSVPPHNRALRARLALLLEDVALDEAHHRFLGVLRGALVDLGHPDPDPVARAATDLLEGALVHAVSMPSRPIKPDELSTALAHLIATR